MRTENSEYYTTIPVRELQQRLAGETAFFKWRKNDSVFVPASNHLSSGYYDAPGLSQRGTTRVRTHTCTTFTRSLFRSKKQNKLNFKKSQSYLLTRKTIRHLVTQCAQTHKHKNKTEKTRISRVPVRFSTNRRPRENNNQNATVIPLLISGRRFSTSLPGHKTTRATHLAHVTQAQDSAQDLKPLASPRVKRRNHRIVVN